MVAMLRSKLTSRGGLWSLKLEIGKEIDCRLPLQKRSELSELGKLFPLVKKYYKVGQRDCQEVSPNPVSRIQQSWYLL